MATEQAVTERMVREVYDNAIMTLRDAMRMLSEMCNETEDPALLGCIGGMIDCLENAQGELK